MVSATLGIFLFHLRNAVYLLERPAPAGKMRLQKRQKPKKPLAIDAKCLLRDIDAVVV